MDPPKLNILVLPVFKKKWMFHAWAATTSTEGSLSLAQRPVEKASIPQRLSALGNTISHKMSSTVQSQWLDMQQAKEGSFKKWLHKLALAVLSREDPTESFLKAVPRSNVINMEIIYPASMNQVLVRRRLRTIALTRAHYHRRSLFGWGLICIPQLPLMLTPFPNLTLYYSVYRLMSHYQAMGGALSLTSVFTHADKLQLQALELQHNRQLQQQEEQRRKRQQRWRLWRKHKASPATSSTSSRAEVPETCTAQHQGGTEKGQAGSSSGKKSGSSAAGAGNGSSTSAQPSLTYCADSALDQMVKPLERWRTPVSDEAIAAVSRRYTLPGLQEYVSRIRAIANAAAAKAAAETTV